MDRETFENKVSEMIGKLTALKREYCYRGKYLSSTTFGADEIDCCFEEAKDSLRKIYKILESEPEDPTDAEGGLYDSDGLYIDF